MKVFKLPDLGEGLPDAIIREWYVKVGDNVKTDQPIVAMETAKALVDVPAPFDGVIEKLFGNVNDTIETGDALIGFEGEGKIEEAKDAGTVVGAIEESEMVLKESAAGITPGKISERARATPAVRALAKRLGVDLSTITPKGDRITATDVEQAVGKSVEASVYEMGEESDMQALTPVRHAMVLSMTKSHHEIVPVTLSDDADIHAWKGKGNITIRIIRAIVDACKAEPMLNATFDSQHLRYRLNDAVHLGIAVDTKHGLYVPVIKDIETLSDERIREKINQFKTQAEEKSIAQKDLHGASIILSNFGAIAGRYANTIILPPMVSIIGVGKLRDEVVAFEGKPTVHPILPLSVTADHRAATGGELARFLKALIESLEK